ncbi:hypothetical protein TNCV_1371951 [Trichonephila clavipes]|nr:hypothetical protein TNCV_1371951 [Trichonephila clavipes]
MIDCPASMRPTARQPSESSIRFLEVIETHSQAAILALSSYTPTDCLNIIQCRTKITKLISYSWTAALEWASSHVEVTDNVRADHTQKASRELSRLNRKSP